MFSRVPYASSTRLKEYIPEIQWNARGYGIGDTQEDVAGIHLVTAM